VLPCRASTWACIPIATTSQGLPLANAVWSGARAAAAFRPWAVTMQPLCQQLPQGVSYRDRA